MFLRKLAGMVLRWCDRAEAGRSSGMVADSAGFTQ